MTLQQRAREFVPAFGVAHRADIRTPLGRATLGNQCRRLPTLKGLDRLGRYRTLVQGLDTTLSGLAESGERTSQGSSLLATLG